jgi:hypothetical protein
MSVKTDQPMGYTTAAPIAQWPGHQFAPALAGEALVTTLPGPLHQTPLVETEGLSVALVQEVTRLNDAVDDLHADMMRRQVPNGIIVLAQNLTEDTLGPVPDELINKGIGFHLSATGDLLAGALAFISEYWDIRNAAQSNLDPVAE